MSQLLPHRCGATPLHCAASTGNASVMTLLLERGADTEVHDLVRRATSNGSGGGGTAFPPQSV
jgi:hypothetical protein